MANLYQTLLLPTPGEVARVVREAVKASNYRFQKFRLSWPLPDWDEFLADYDAHPEGQKLWLGGTPADIEEASRIAVVWWTDRAGQRHVRIAGERGQFTDRSRLPLLGVNPPWPPLAILDERLFLRTVRGESRWLALCSCGVFGPPERLGWMGGRCGPCHDRAEAREPLPPAPAWMGSRDDGFIRWLAFSPDGLTLVSNTNSIVRFFDVPSGLQIASHTFKDSTWEIAFVPDGSALAAGTRNALCLLNPRDGKLITSLPVQAYGGYVVDELTFTPDGRQLFGVQAGTLFLLDLQGGNVARVFSGGYRHLALSPNGRTLAATDECGRLRFWDADAEWFLPQPDWVAELEHPWQPVDHQSWSPDGRLLAGATRNPDESYSLRVWDVAAGKELFRRPVPYCNGWWPTFSPDGRLLVACQGESIGAWDMVMRELVELSWGNDAVLAVAFSPDGRWLATAGFDNTVRLWPAELLRGKDIPTR